MSSDTAKTVKRARELMDLGVDPIVLMSQMATLIMDIIAGTYSAGEAKHSSSFFGGRSCKCYFYFTFSVFFFVSKMVRLLQKVLNQLLVLLFDQSASSYNI